ncbi:hypothetical protein [Streptomyces shaanxiensis]
MNEPTAVGSTPPGRKPEDDGHPSARRAAHPEGNAPSRAQQRAPA